ncbi:MAG: MFS transporter [Synergistaceae bacterium]|nr:MFS transporter [Synergistaceae bacterium]
MGLNISVFFMMIGVGMIVALLPQKVIQFDGNGQNVGYLASMFAVAYIALQVPVGAMADKYGFKIFLAIGYFLCFLAGLCFYFSSSSYSLFLTRLLQGAGEAPVWALAPAMLSVKYPLEKSSIIGRYNAILHIGLTLGPICGVYLGKACQSGFLFLLYSLGCLFGMLLILVFVEDVRPAEKNSITFDLSAISRLVKDRKILIALIGITLYGSAYGIFLTAIPSYLLQEKNFSTEYMGAFFSLFYAAISVSQIITGRLSCRFGAGFLMVLGLFIASLGLIAIHFSGSFGILFLLTIASLGLGVFYLSSMIFLNDTVDSALKGTISGAYYLFWGVGMFFGPSTLSAASRGVGFSLSLKIFAVLFTIIALAMLVLLVPLCRKRTRG